MKPSVFLFPLFRKQHTKEDWVTIATAKTCPENRKNVHFLLFTLEIKWLVLGAVTKFLFEPRLVLKLWTPGFFRYFQKCAHFSSEPVHGPRNMKNCAVRGVAHFPLFQWRKEKTTPPGIEPGSQPIDPSPLRLHGFNRCIPRTIASDSDGWSEAREVCR